MATSLRAPVVVAVAALVVASGLAASAAAAGHDGAATTGDRVPPAETPAQSADSAAASAVSPSAAAQANASNASDRPDPPVDVLGWEGGYWYDEAIDVDQSDGLTDAELSAYVHRAMARVERLSGIEFTEDVAVTVRSREAYRAGQGPPGGSGEFWDWNDQVWEGLFVVGEDTNASDAFAELSSEAVLGFYDPVGDRLVVIAEDTETPVVDNATLVHELVHAAQDQRYDLTSERYRGETQDEQLAIDAVVEGEATLVEERYAERCAGEWDCVATPGESGSGGDVNLGLLITLLSPYSDGMAFVDRLTERYGPSAVAGLHEDPPESMEQVIHLEPGEAPDPIAFEDRARGGWTTFPDQGENGSDTVGEASIYAMFWYQSRRTGVDLVDVGAFSSPDDGPYDYYNYTAAPSSGWANDRLVPYRNGGRRGYVWVTEWDTEADAGEFRDAYVRMLAANGASLAGPSTWVVPSGPFADAFRVVQRGTTVTIVNAPTREGLDELRPGLGAGTATPSPTPSPTPAPAPTGDNSTAGALSRGP